MVRRWAVLYLGLAMVGCGSDSKAMTKNAASSFEANSGAPRGALPPGEKEASNDKFLQVSPAYTEDFIFVANSAVDSISKISVAEPHTITVIPTGLYPQVIKSIGDRVSVLNGGDHSVTFITAPTNQTFTLPINKDINDIAYNTSGYGLGYVNSAKLDPEITGGSQSEGQIAVIDISSGKITANGVDFLPKTIVFSESNPPLALVATDAKGALFNLASATKTSLTFSATPLSANALSEALISPDGARAFFREQGANGVRVLEVSTPNSVWSLAADAVQTDMDLSRDGKYLFLSDNPTGSNYRLRKYDAKVPALTILKTLNNASGYAQTEFSPDGSRGVVFTTSTSENAVGLYDVATDILVDKYVEHPVAGVSIAPDSKTAVLVHDPESSPQRITFLNLETQETPSLILQGTLHQISFSRDGAFVFITTRYPDYLNVYALRQSSYAAVPLNYQPMFLSALPIAVGGKSFVTQNSTSGSVTFLDVISVDSNVNVNARTLQGFLLGTTVE